MYPQTKEQALLRRALDALYKATGLTGRVVEEVKTGTDKYPGDLLLEIQTDNQAYTYIAEIKRIDRFVMLEQLRNQLGNHADQMLLVAPRITAEIADKCRELGVQFIDTAGNIFLRQHGLYIFIKGQRPAAGDGTHPEELDRPRAATATHLRVVFALLCKPDLLNAPYRDIAHAANVALGTIGWVFNDLNARGFTTGGKNNGERVLLERKRLMQEWATNFPIKLRPKLNTRRFRATTEDWWKQLDITKYGAQWGGEEAADKLTGYLKPEFFTIYMHETKETNNLTKLVVDQRLRADPQGNIEILDAFWEFKGEATPQATVPPLLVYADLLATLDPRNLETARMIYEQHI